MALAGIVPTIAQAGWGWGHHSWWGALMMIGWWLLIAAVVVLVARAFGHQSGSTSTGGAEQVLGERYARGEIDETEYRTRLAVMKEHR